MAVDDLSLHIPKGVIYGIIGPNGAGKTTTIRMIMNIIAPDAGRILLEGKPIDASFKDRVGYLPEERGLYKKMTLADVITFLAELKDYPVAKTREKMDGWLEKMGLLEYKHRKVEELSKGMAQKLQFITTIIHEPEIAILDELFSGLDPVNIEVIKDVLLDLKRDGKTILFSTHVMEQAEKLCDNICMISNGQKVLDGTMSEVKAQFGRNTLQVEIEGDGAFIGSLPGVQRVTEFNNYVEIHLADGANPQDILRALVERVTVRRFEVMEPSLYDIFIEKAKVTPDALQGEEVGRA
ncbi:MAG: ATP-binding cassette domain-containing protein [Candidatus Zixiibacteriota bacterium]|nr:MAG: ATP-binding cassette domain-containing protein [candidate division Zixibacteria bacterium]